MVQKGLSNLLTPAKKLKFRRIRLLSPNQQQCLGSLVVPEGLEGIWIGQFGKDVVGVPRATDLLNSEQFLVPLLDKAPFHHQQRPGWIFYFSESEACRVLSVWSNMLCLSFTQDEMDKPAKYIEHDASLVIWNLSKGITTKSMSQQNFQWATYLVPLSKINTSPLTLKNFKGH